MRGLFQRSAFAADPAGAMNDKGFFRDQRQRDREITVVSGFMASARQ